MKKIIIALSMVFITMFSTMSCDKKPKIIFVYSVSLNKSDITLTEGESATLVATVVPNDATNKNVTWKSDNTDVATVDNTGKVIAVKAGSATITVTTEDGSKTATCKVTVKIKGFVNSDWNSGHNNWLD